MSTDVVDDLHAAEDMIGTLMTAIDAIVGAWESGDLAGAVNEAAGLTGPWCRPSCGAEGDEGIDCGDDTCGCPCGHRSG